MIVHDISNSRTRIDGVIITVFPSSVVDCWFEPRSGLFKDYAIGIVPREIELGPTGNNPLDQPRVIHCSLINTKAVVGITSGDSLLSHQHQGCSRHNLG